MIRPLPEVLAYENAEVVYRFSDDFGIPFSDAHDVFTETKRWLWLCARHREAKLNRRGAPPVLPLISEAHALDLMWHTFLLFTKDYAEFCTRNFGFFIHHTPLTHEQKEAERRESEADPEGALRARRQSLRVVYGYIYDELGAAILKRWCEEFPERFRDIGGNP